MSDSDTTASIHIERRDAETGEVTHTSDAVLDTETGQTVVTGDELSANAEEFMGLLGGIAAMMENDPEIDS